MLCKFHYVKKELDVLNDEKVYKQTDGQPWKEITLKYIFI